MSIDGPGTLKLLTIHSLCYVYLLTPVQGSAKVIPGELNPLTISFFLLLLWLDFEIGGNFAVAIIHIGIVLTNFLP